MSIVEIAAWIIVLPVLISGLILAISVVVALIGWLWEFLR